jgi:glycosyltransferase involved in cell wall biosynthesis
MSDPNEATGVTPSLSIVLPVYNEEAILDETLRAILSRVRSGPCAEIVLVLNGCRDRSEAIARNWAERDRAIRVISRAKASYGAAIRTGILESRAPVVAIFNADFYDFGFLDTALPLLTDCHCVVGSKMLRASRDSRPAMRRWVTRVFNLLLRYGFGYLGSDTHGLKAMSREALTPIAQQCVTDREIFDTEVLVRAQRAGLRIREIPVRVTEMRATRLALARRVASTIADLVRIRVSLCQGPDRNFPR